MQRSQMREINEPSYWRIGIDFNVLDWLKYIAIYARRSGTEF